MIGLPQFETFRSLDVSPHKPMRPSLKRRIFPRSTPLAGGIRFGYGFLMSIKERAIAAIDSLPADSNVTDISREIAIITGGDESRQKMDRGECLDATETVAPAD